MIHIKNIWVALLSYQKWSWITEDRDDNYHLLNTYYVLVVLETRTKCIIYVYSCLMESLKRHYHSHFRDVKPGTQKHWITCLWSHHSQVSWPVILSLLLTTRHALPSINLHTLATLSVILLRCVYNGAFYFEYRHVQNIYTGSWPPKKH